MITVKVTFSDGDSLVTRINATLDGAKRYYLGNRFNLGGKVNPVEDRVVTAVNVELVPPLCSCHPVVADGKVYHHADCKGGA